MKRKTLLRALVFFHLFGAAGAKEVPSTLPAQTYGAPGDYPIPMGFRRASMDSLNDILYQGQVVIGTATRDYRVQEKVVLEFKKRRPDSRVLVQYYWSAFPRSVPLQIAAASNHRFLSDRDYYPYPKFNGFYLCQHPALLRSDFSVAENPLTVKLGMQGGWPSLSEVAKRNRRPLIGLLYALDELGEADFTRSEFVRITVINFQKGEAKLTRIAPAPGSTWQSYEKNRARIGLPAFLTAWETLFYPNLTSSCPRDPETGMNAVEYWSSHIARYFRKRLPGIDGLAFDVPPFAPQHGADIDNDGVVDHGYRDGINHIGLGLYDFFEALRMGSTSDPGLGNDFLLSIDGQEMADQRFPDLANGAENEDFPGFMDFSRFSEQFHSHLWWCDRARDPNTSYPVMRFPTAAYHNANDSERLLPWMTNGHARMGIATACFGNGVVAYEASRVWENGTSIVNLEDTSRKEPPPFVLDLPHYPWDEYNAGNRNRFGWLGKPTGPMVRLDSPLGDELLEIATFEAIPREDPVIQVSPLKTVAQSRSLEIDISFRGTPALPWTSMAGPQGFTRLEATTSVVLRSSALHEIVSKGQELCIAFIGSADADYREVDEKYRAIPIPFGLRLRMAGQGRSQSTWVYLDRKASPIRITLVAPADGIAQLEILAGTEPGLISIAGLSVRRGCAEVAWRPFEHGLVLMNASTTSEARFPVASMEPDREFRRLEGTIDPQWNDGRPAGDTVVLPPNEALFLEVIPPT